MFHPEMWNPTRQLWKGEGAAAANGKLCWALGQNSVKQHYKNPVKTNELLILLSTVVPDLLQIQTGGPRPPVSCRRAGLSGCWDISCTSPLPVGLSCPVVPMLSPQLCHVCQCFSLLPPWDVVSVQEHHQILYRVLVISGVLESIARVTSAGKCWQWSRTSS